MIKLDNEISIPAVASLGLQALGHTLPASTKSRDVKVYKVPADVSTDNYFVSVRETDAPEPMPTCRQRDTVLLAEYALAPDGTSSVLYIHKEVLNAAG